MVNSLSALVALRDVSTFLGPRSNLSSYWGFELGPKVVFGARRWP